MGQASISNQPVVPKKTGVDLTVGERLTIFVVILGYLLTSSSLIFIIALAGVGFWVIYPFIWRLDWKPWAKIVTLVLIAVSLGYGGFTFARAHPTVSIGGIGSPGGGGQRTSFCPTGCTYIGEPGVCYHIKASTINTLHNFSEAMLNSFTIYFDESGPACTSGEHTQPIQLGTGQTWNLFGVPLSPGNGYSVKFDKAPVGVLMITSS